MSKNIRIATVTFKSEAYRNKPEAQRVVLEELQRNSDALCEHYPDLVVFSEGVEAIGQTVDQAESLDNPGPILQAYQAIAKRHNTTIAASVKLTEGGNAFNSIAFISPTGEMLGRYHKTYLTITELDMGLTPGEGAVVVDTPAGRLGGAVCFDLNFLDLCEQYRPLKPDVIAFASMYHGGLMQAHWAYRNRSFFTASLPFLGSAVLDPFGNELTVTDCYSPIASTTVNLDRTMVHLDFNRDKFPDIRKKYKDEVEVFIPANVGPAVIYSHSDKRTAMDIVREFELELVDDYLDRSVEANNAARPAPLAGV